MPQKSIHRATDYFSHNRARLLRGGHDYFDLLADLIQGARHTIHFQTYIFDDDETGTTIAEALIAAAERGVSIFLLCDGYASQKLSPSLIERLRKSGVRFCWFEPFFKSKKFYFGRRLHHKVVVIDSCRALVGGLNISNRYNDLPDQPAWLDWALFTEGEVVAALENICKKKIKYHRFKIKNITGEPAMITETCSIRVRVNDWIQRKRQISRSYLEMFNQANSRIIIMSPYFLPGNEFRRRMAAASKRGVKIKLVLAGVSDISIAKWAERYVYQWLFRNHIDVYEYQKNILHGKMAVHDGEWMTIGSYNVNNLSAYASVELNLDVDNNNLAMEAEKQMQRIIEQDCIQVTQDSYNRNITVFKRLTQWLAYESLRLLLYLTTFNFKQRE